MRAFLAARVQILWWVSPAKVYAIALTMPAVLAVVFLIVAAVVPGAPLHCHPAAGAGRPHLSCTAGRGIP